MSYKATCIVPAWNEEGRAINVINTILKNDNIAEVIAVDDKSTDNTLEELKSIKNNKLKVIAHEKNMGKSEAIYTGLKNATNDVVLNIDSDLKGLTPRHLDQMAQPVYDDIVDITMHAREPLLVNRRIPILAKFMSVSTAFTAGERCYKYSKFKDFYDNNRGYGYGLESLMNEYIIKNNIKVGVVRWQDVQQINKLQKLGFFAWLKADFKAWKQMFAQMKPWKMIRYFFKLKNQAIEL